MGKQFIQIEFNWRYIEPRKKKILNWMSYLIFSCTNLGAISDFHIIFLVFDSKPES